MAAGRKVGHAPKARGLAHMRPLFRLYDTLRERYDGLRPEARWRRSTTGWGNVAYRPLVEGRSSAFPVC